MIAEPGPYPPLDMTCGTCRCDRRWHFKTYDGIRAGCTRKIGYEAQVPCPCGGFMATESKELRGHHEKVMGRRIFRMAVERQNTIDGAKYRATLP